MPSHVPWIVNGVNGLTLMLAPLPVVEDQKGGHVGRPAVITVESFRLKRQFARSGIIVLNLMR